MKSARESNKKNSQSCVQARVQNFQSRNAPKPELKTDSRRCLMRKSYRKNFSRAPHSMDVKICALEMP
jgi:hypothetical protein